MRGLLVALFATVSLAACQGVAPYYTADNYYTQQWATKSFDEAKAVCRHAHLQEDAIWGTMDLDVGKYKTCMEKNGFRFRSTGLFGEEYPATGTRNIEPPREPSQPVDKSALYR